MRATSSPAAIMSVMTPGASVAGPRVATIFVLRPVSIMPLSFGATPKARPAGTLRRSAGGPRLQHRDRRQRFAFHKFEERAAACGNIRDPVGDAVFFDRGQRITAAGQRVGAAAGNRVGDGVRAFAELVELKHADRSVPDNRAGALEQCAK